MARRSLRFLVAALLSASVLPAAVITPAALAQEEGVTLDPSDPAAKEYSLPTAEARREASGDTGRVAQGAGDAALFGEGVSKDDAGADASDGSSGSEGSGSTKTSADDDAAGASASADDSSGAASGSQPATTEAQAGGVGSTTALIGGGVLALLATGLGGLALRATRGPADS